MSKLDELVPSANDGLYKVEIQVEGEWISLCGLSKGNIIKVVDLAEWLSDEDNGEEKDWREREKFIEELM